MTSTTPKTRQKRKLEDTTNKQFAEQVQDKELVKPEEKQQGKKKAKVEVQVGDKETPNTRRSQRSSVKCAGSYKEGGRDSFSDKEFMVEVKSEETVNTEGEALELTKSEQFRRRLFNFEVVDSQDDRQPIQRFDFKTKGEEWFIKGSIVGSSPEGNKKEKIVIVSKKFGPIESWKVDYKKQTAEIVLKTAASEYGCTKPSNQYRKDFSFLKEQVELASMVYGMLDAKKGGSLETSFEQAAAKLGRTKFWKNKYPTPNAALSSNANFLLGQLKNMSETLEFLDKLENIALMQELRKEISNSSYRILQPQNKGIVIRDRDENQMDDQIQDNQQMNDVVMSNPDMMADEEFARRVQAEMDVLENRQGRKTTTSKEAYIQVSMEEIADDYPEPQFYMAAYEEIDELMLADEEVCLMHRDDLPRCVLDDFVIYNAEGLFSTLELLPLMQGVDPDLDMFASGQVMEDDSEWVGGRLLGVTSDPDFSDGVKEGAGSSGVVNMGESGVMEVSEGVGEGIRLYLSQIREWVVEYSADMMFISLCTSAAWYRLCRPHNSYKKWFDVIVKCARIAVKVMKLINVQVRASRLSFSDVVRMLAQQEESELTFISKKIDVVRRFVTVHGQLILNQFKYFPNKSVQNCAFVNHLKQEMQMMRHSKLYSAKVKQISQKDLITKFKAAKENKNPMKQKQSSKSNRPKPMAATATTMVKSIWEDYFKVDKSCDEVMEKESEQASKPSLLLTEGEEDDEEDEEDVKKEQQEQAVNHTQVSPQRVKEIYREQIKSKEIQYADKCASDSDFYGTVVLGEVKICVGDIVELGDGNIAMLQCVNGAKKVGQFRKMLKGVDTMLSDCASSTELFMTPEVLVRSLSNIQAKLGGIRIKRKEDHEQRDKNQKNDRERKAGDKSVYIFRSLYLPDQGMFKSIPEDLQLGQFVNTPKNDNGRATVCGDGDAFEMKGEKYSIGDSVLLIPSSYDETQTKKESVPDPYDVAELMGFQQNNKVVSSLKVRLYHRPHLISEEIKYTAGLWEVYQTAKTISVFIDQLVKRCEIVREDSKAGFVDGVYKFVCKKSINLKTNKIEPLDGVDQSISPPLQQSHGVIEDGIALAAMDIFAGCGGLTEGMHQARAVDTKWAIEYEAPAAEAFKKNHPNATMFNNNCNVILTAAMHKAGKMQECVAHIDALKEADKLDEEIQNSIPLPGEVQFITGGPPCQGYSGMNRFNKETWSVMQNSMVMAFLSFVDFYRPRYFLLENVRNFVHHNGSRTLRLTVRTLLDIGYQVRMGLLNAGLFGVPQSRRRTFIMAALPGEKLPEWPTPLHVFQTQNLTITFKDGNKFNPVPQDMTAPLRSITVEDAIGDLPVIENGDSKVEKEYSTEPQSDYQRCIRGDCDVLQDHICKTLDELNYERCRHIPHDPKCDWRALLDVVKNDPSKEKFKGKPLVPWCLPNTAARHNNWQGLFGRLDFKGFFPTSTTDPCPMGKVGRVFHPNQNRIVSVRECARAQGFPDRFVFFGTISNKHRQVGNAVPPPLAKAIGIQLRKVLDEKDREQAIYIMRAQML